jgi:aspartyl-tRNA(Asn)/glutamyl-tRNA(Gln) amidotransferase subunit A
MYLADVFTIPANMAGIPGVAIPCGFSEGLPVSLQILGPPFAEATILRIGDAYERCESWAGRRPGLEPAVAAGEP